jgi:hypothetical protein
LFGDSQGRIWLGLGWDINQTKYAGMFDGNQWTYYEAKDGLNYSPTAFAEDLQGRVWSLASNQLHLFEDGRWSRPYYSISANNLLTYDQRDNLYLNKDDMMLANTSLSILWGGEDFPMTENGEWVSPSQYRITYEMTQAVPKGTYALTIANAAGSDGLEVLPDQSYTFEVYYAGAVTDGTPPSKPRVIAESDGSLNRLSFRWSSHDPQGLLNYRYAIGTAPGGKDILGWTVVPKTTTAAIQNNLRLVSGQTYYVSVSAQNSSGLWGPLGVSNPITGGQVTQISIIFLPSLKR